MRGTSVSIFNTLKANIFKKCETMSLNFQRQEKQLWSHCLYKAVIQWSRSLLRFDSHSLQVFISLKCGSNPKITQQKVCFVVLTMKGEKNM